MAHPVYLYRYDLSNGMARSMSRFLIGRELEGIWHTSIVVFGYEFYFDGGVGIIREPQPGSTRFGAPYRTEILGDTQRTESDFLLWTQLEQLEGGNFGPDCYDLLSNNCNHFTQAASQFLLAQDIPPDVREMIPMLLSTPLGQMLRPLLSQTSSKSVTANNAAADNGAFASLSTLSVPRPEINPPQAVVSSPALSSPCRGLLGTKSTFTENEAEDLILAKVMLETNELLKDGSDKKGVQTTIQSLEFLRRFLQDIIDHPEHSQYRSLSTDSKTYVEKLKPIEPFGLFVLLCLSGFVFQPQSTDTGIGKWILSDANGSQTLLQHVVYAIDDVIDKINLNAAMVLSLKDANNSCPSVSFEGPGEPGKQANA